jgi:hypothetical protein
MMFTVQSSLMTTINRRLADDQNLFIVQATGKVGFVLLTEWQVYKMTMPHGLYNYHFKLLKTHNDCYQHFIS